MLCRKHIYNKEFKRTSVSILMVILISTILLNMISGILHKGDGSNIYLKEKPQELVSILGNGIQRSLDCAMCNGDASNNQVRAPVALASGSDGSLYIWDYNFIRKLSPGRTEIVSILKTEYVYTGFRNLIFIVFFLEKTNYLGKYIFMYFHA